MVLFLLVTSWTFWNAVQRNVGSHEPLSRLLVLAVLLWLPILVTVVTMRLFAEEKRSGTIETLMTAPVTEAQVVLGKYLGALTFVAVVLAPMGACPFVLRALAPGVRAVDVGQLCSAGLFLLLVAGLCVAVGLLVSMMTRNQIVAAIGCFCAVLVPLLLPYVVSLLPFGSDRLIQAVSVESHMLEFTRGSIDARPVVLYVSCTVLLLFTAVRVLESRRWR
jgi:ABC-2 type transport system permease protein